MDENSSHWIRLRVAQQDFRQRNVALAVVTDKYELELGKEPDKTFDTLFAKCSHQKDDISNELFRFQNHRGQASES